MGYYQGGGRTEQRAAWGFYNVQYSDGYKRREVAWVHATPKKVAHRFVDQRMNMCFGNSNLTLHFKDRHDLAYYQPVQFRFNRTGTNAASRVIAAGTLSPNYVAAGNPNWYVYWQQVANGFTFGPQAQEMVFSNAVTDSTGSHGSYRGGPTGPGYAWKDNITIYKKNESDIVDFIETIHHEESARDRSSVKSQPLVIPQAVDDKMVE